MAETLEELTREIADDMAKSLIDVVRQGMAQAFTEAIAIVQLSAEKFRQAQATGPKATREHFSSAASAMDHAAQMISERRREMTGE